MCIKLQASLLDETEIFQISDEDEDEDVEVCDTK